MDGLDRVSLISAAVVLEATRPESREGVVLIAAVLEYPAIAGRVSSPGAGTHTPVRLGRGVV